VNLLSLGRPFVAAAIACAFALGVASCQPGSLQPSPSVPADISDRVPLADIDWLNSPRDWIGPSTALLTTHAVTPIQDKPATPALPVTVTSDDLAGPREVTVSSAERIIAVDMAGSLAQTLWGLGVGDRLVGRDISTTFPGTEDLPVVTGTGHAISPESVLALRPDLIITDGTVGPIDVMLQLRQAGVTVVFIQTPPGVSHAAEQARRVAEVVGLQDAGQALAEKIERDIREVTATIRDNTPVAREHKLRMMFLYLRGSSGIYYLFGSESGAGELIDALGGIDVAGEIGWAGLRPVTDEALIAANPDLILVMTGGLTSVGGVEQLVRVKPAIGLTRAGQNLRFVDMADSEVLGFGPRTPLVLDALARAIYAPEPSATPAR
jgi:iron complex transport system substrate-binding protein